MKIVIPGGSGSIGQVLLRHFLPLGHEVIVLTRKPRQGTSDVNWDSKTLGIWKDSLEGADVVINLAGKSVNCRYNTENLKEMMDSRVESTKVLGEAIAGCVNPPKVWLQASTATIYEHRFDAPNDETTGILGGDEAGAPKKWNASIAIAKAWEKTLEEAPTPGTRKVALRSSLTLSPDTGSIFDVMATLARRGLGGMVGSGKQYVSWIHEIDFVRALEFIIQHEELRGAVNVCSPNPLPNKEFSKALRDAVGAPISFPTPSFALEIGAIAMGTETELLLKSRRVVPKRLLDAGFTFTYPYWEGAAKELGVRWRSN